MAVALACGPVEAGDGKLAVTAVRFWTLTDVTRVAIETNGAFRFHRDRLQDPPRLFFDFFGARSRVGKSGALILPVGDERVRRIRVAETLPAVTRVVLDLEDPAAEFVASQLGNPDRLMVEVRGAAPRRPAETVLPSDRRFAPPSAKAGVPGEILLPPPGFGVPVPLRLEQIPPIIRAASRPVSIYGAPYPRPAASWPPEGAVAVPPGERPAPASRDSLGSRSMTRALGLKIGRVVLDPGHGGHDTGTIGPAGTMEKDIALDVAKRLGALLTAKLSSEVLYTRDEDRFVSLEERGEFANRHRADLFLSIHVNSSPSAGVVGVETYYLNFTTSRTALEVASRENAGARRKVHELRELLQKIALKDKVDESRELAAKVQLALNRRLYGGAHSRDRGVKKAPFVVLIGTAMPAALAEIGFISNPREEAQLRREEYRQKVAEALLEGISSYMRSLSHFQVAATAGGGVAATASAR